MRKTIIALAALILSACDWPSAQKFTPPIAVLTVDDLLTIGPETCEYVGCLNRSVTFHVTGDKALLSSIRLTHRNATGRDLFTNKIINPVRRVPFSWTYEFGSFEEGSLKLTFHVWKPNRGGGEFILFTYEGGQ